jgi:hypothetical protein
LLLLKGRLYVHSAKLRLFKIWQANTLRSELNTLCKTLGRSKRKEKLLALISLNCIASKHLYRVFAHWRLCQATRDSTFLGKKLDEPQVVSFMRMMRILVLKGKQQSRFFVHLDILKQMVIRNSSN